MHMFIKNQTNYYYFTICSLYLFVSLIYYLISLSKQNFSKIKKILTNSTNVQKRWTKIVDSILSYSVYQ